MIDDSYDVRLPMIKPIEVYDVVFYSKYRRNRDEIITVMGR